MRCNCAKAPEVSDTPHIDVIISTFNEERYIGRCLEETLRQHYPAERIHVYVVDGGSQDNTVAILREYASLDSRLMVIADGRRRNLPEALNIALASSRSEFVAKIDAHGHPDRDFLHNAIAAFNSSEDRVACVGGRPIQCGETGFGAALAIARASAFGVGGSGYAGTTQTEFVKSVQCGVYRREALVKVGAFDASMNYGEDDELNWRLIKTGYRILLDTGIQFYYITRPTWTAAYRQYRNYGEARVNVLRKHPDFFRSYHLVPALAVSGTLFLAALSPIWRPARYLVGCLGVAYIGTAAVAAVRSKPPPKRAIIPIIVYAFSALHAGYGIGMLSGVRKLLLRRSA